MRSSAGSFLFLIVISSASYGQDGATARPRSRGDFVTLPFSSQDFTPPQTEIGDAIEAVGSTAPTKQNLRAHLQEAINIRAELDRGLCGAGARGIYARAYQAERFINGTAGYRAAQRVLVETLQKRQQNAYLAAAGLCHAGPDCDWILPSLVQALSWKTDNATRARAALAIGRLGAKSEAAVPKLIEVLQEPVDEENSYVRAEVFDALGRIGPSARRAVPFLREGLSDRDREARANAALALWRVSGDTIQTMPVLIAILTTGRPGDSQPPSIAMKCLAQIGPAAKAAAPSLLKVLKEPDVAPGSPAPDALDEPARKAGQVEAADALLHIGEEPARPIAILRRMLADTRSTPSWAHLHAAEILLERKIDTGYAMELLGDWVKHGGPDRAPAALDVLARLSPDPSAAVARIKPALHNGSALVRQAAVESLGKLGPAASSSIPDLRIAQIDANQFVRWQATWALSRIGGGDAK